LYKKWTKFLSFLKTLIFLISLTNWNKFDNWYPLNKKGLIVILVPIYFRFLEILVFLFKNQFFYLPISNFFPTFSILHHFGVNFDDILSLIMVFVQFTKYYFDQNIKVVLTKPGSHEHIFFCENVNYKYRSNSWELCLTKNLPFTFWYKKPTFIINGLVTIIIQMPQTNY
jgi:hypothetical protein